MFHSSAAITKFFTDNEHHEGFWDFIHENDIYDAQWWDGDDDGPGLIERGFDLAVSAGKNLVYAIPYGKNSTLILYFIGGEDQILEKLKEALQDWLEEDPPETPKQKQQAKIKKLKDDAALRLKQAAKELQDIEAIEADLDSDES